MLVRVAGEYGLELELWETWHDFVAWNAESPAIRKLAHGMRLQPLSRDEAEAADLYVAFIFRKKEPVP